jgi:hypothetical protein
MSDDKSKRGAAVRRTVAGGEPYEVESSPAARDRLRLGTRGGIGTNRRSEAPR